MIERELIERALFLIAGEWGPYPPQRDYALSWLMQDEDQSDAPTWWLTDPVDGEATEWARWKDDYLSKPLPLVAGHDVP